MSKSHATPRRPLIAVIGDSRVQPDSLKDKLAFEIGQSLVDVGYRVVTGGLGGIMESACRGAKASAKYQPGDTVGIVPGHDSRTANQYVDIAIASGLDHVRNAVVAHADATIVIGGGAGTLSEICFAWIHKRLIIAMRVEGWSGRLADERLDDRIRYSVVNDDRIFGATTVAEAMDVLESRLGQYDGQHSRIPGPAPQEL